MISRPTVLVSRLVALFVDGSASNFLTPWKIREFSGILADTPSANSP